MGKQVNQRELSEILGVTQVTLWQWQKDGMPLLLASENGKANQYDTEQVIAWWIAREVSKVQTETPKDRLARLQGDRVQREMDILDRRLIPVEEIEPAWLAMVQSARSYLRAEPDRLAHLLDVTDGVDAKRDLLSETFDEFLRKLATYDSGDDDDAPAARTDAPGDGEVRAAAEDDGSGVV